MASPFTATRRRATGSWGGRGLAEDAGAAAREVTAAGAWLCPVRTRPGGLPRFHARASDYEMIPKLRISLIVIADERQGRLIPVVIKISDCRRLDSIDLGELRR